MVTLSISNVMWRTYGVIAATALVAAAQPTPAGLWKTLDDKTGRPRGVVRVYEQNGEFLGRVVDAVEPKERREICDRCTGERKDKPVIGMVILWGLRRHGGEYTGGQILDPDTGSVYHCKARLSDKGRKLLLRGYIGVPLLGRSQVWVREP
jgi:uncharacterized protein (DUF2147 family)